MIVIQRKGFVLAAALLALLMIAGLVAAVFFAANEGTRISVASSERQLALAAAESAAEDAIAGWTTADGALAVGATIASSWNSDGMPVSTYTTRLDPTLIWIVADAGPARVGSGVRARIGALVIAKNVVGGGASVERISDRWWSELF